MRCMWQKVMIVNMITTEDNNEGDKNCQRHNGNWTKVGNNMAPLALVANALVANSMCSTYPAPILKHV